MTVTHNPFGIQGSGKNEYNTCKCNQCEAEKNRQLQSAVHKVWLKYQKRAKSIKIAANA